MIQIRYSKLQSRSPTSAAAAAAAQKTASNDLLEYPAWTLFNSKLWFQWQPLYGCCSTWTLLILAELRTCCSSIEFEGAESTHYELSCVVSWGRLGKQKSLPNIQTHEGGPPMLIIQICQLFPSLKRFYSERRVGGWDEEVQQSEIIIIWKKYNCTTICRATKENEEIPR